LCAEFDCTVIKKHELQLLQNKLRVIACKNSKE